MNIVIVVNKLLLERDYRIRLALKTGVKIAMPIENKTISGVETYSIRISGGFNIFRDFIGYFDLIKLIVNNRDSVFHFYSSKYYTVGPVLCWLFNCKSKPIISINGLGRLAKNNSGFKYNILLFLVKLGVKNSQGVIFQNSSDHELFLNAFKKQMAHVKSKVIYSALDTIDQDLFFKKSLKGLDERKKIFFIGRQNKDKGIDLFYELAKKQYRNYDFEIIGEAPEDPEDLKNLNLLIDDGKIKWHGYLSNVYPYIYSSLCVIIPSNREGLSRVLMESYACNTPVIGFDVPGVSEFIVASKTGEIAFERTVQSLEEALDKVSCNGKDYYKEEIINFFIHNFSMDTFIKETSLFYKQLMDRNN